MENQDGKLLHSIALDLSQLKRDTENVRAMYSRISDHAIQEGKRVDAMFSNLSKTAGAYFSVSMAKDFVNQLVNVRGEIESLEVAYTVLLGSKEKSDKMLADMKQFSIKTPLTLTDISQAGQTLLSFNIDAEKVMPTIKMLGDVSLGNVDKFQRLSLAFAQTSAMGRLMGQDLLQMVNAGFNPLQYISEATGKSMAQLKKEMEDGKISSDLVAKAFESATGEGGKFNNMLEKQSESIKGLKSNLQDIITNELNNFGKENEDIIKGILSGTIEAVRNYKEIGQVIAELVIVYGSYKAALILVTTLTEAYTLQTALATASGVAFTTTQAAAATATSTLQAAMLRLNATISANPYAIAAAGLAAMSFIIYKVVTSESELEKTHRRMTDALTESNAAIGQEQAQIDILFNKLRNAKKGTDEYNSAKSNIISQYGQYLKGLGDEKTALDNVALAYKTISNNAVEAAKARALASSSQKEYDLYGEFVKSNTEKAQEEIYKKLGKNKGEIAYQTLAGVLSGNTSPNSAQKKLIDSFNFKDIASASMPGMGSAVQSVGQTYNFLNDIIESNKKAKSDLEKNIRTLEKVFPTTWISTPETPGTTPPATGTGTGLTDKQKAQIEKEKNERLEKIKELNAEIAQALKDGELELTQIKVDAMQEGLDKEFAQIDLTYQRMLTENENRLKDMISKQADIADLEWQKTHQDAVKKGEVFNRENVSFWDLSKNQQDQYKAFIDFAIKYKTAEEDKARKEQADKDLKKAKEKAENEVDLFVRASEARAQIATLRNSGGKFVWNADKEKADLEIQLKALTEQKAKLEELNKSFPDTQTAADIERVNAEIEKLNKNIDEIPGKKINEMLSGFESLASTLSGLDGTAGEMFGSLAKGISNASAAAKAFNDTNMSSSEKNLTYITSIANTAIDLVNMVTESYQKRKDAEKEYYQDALAFAHEYALALNEQLRLQTEISSNGFVKNYSGEITDGFNALSDATLKYDEAIAKLSDGLAKTGQRNAIDWTNVGKGVMGAGIVGGLIGLFGGKKKEDVFGGILEVYHELVNQNGELNKSLAQTLISTNQLDENTKQLVQNALDWQTAIETANEQISNIVNDLAGDLGSSLQTALVNAWKSGEDASTAMFDIASQSLENFVTNMIYSTVFSGVFDKFKESLKQSLSLQGDQNVVDDYRAFIDNYLSQQDAFKNSMNDIKKLSEQYGFKFSEIDANGGLTAKKGIAQASQDSVDELNGRFTAVQGHTFSIAESMKIANDISKNQLNALNRIDTNTARLEAVENHMSNMKNTLEDIKNQGIKLK